MPSLKLTGSIEPLEPVLMGVVQMSYRPSVHQETVNHQFQLVHTWKRKNEEKNEMKVYWADAASYESFLDIVARIS